MKPIGKEVSNDVSCYALLEMMCILYLSFETNFKLLTIKTIFLCKVSDADADASKIMSLKGHWTDACFEF